MRMEEDGGEGWRVDEGGRGTRRDEKEQKGGTCPALAGAQSVCHPPAPPTRSAVPLGSARRGSQATASAVQPAPRPLNGPRGHGITSDR